MDGLMDQEQMTDMEMNADSDAAMLAGDIPREDADIIARAMKNFKLAESAETEIRKEALEDYKFRAGEQWPEEIKNARENDKRPCLTVNQIPQFVNQILNDLRQSKPGINVNATGDHAREDTAEILQGLVRHIEYSSNADIAYARGSEGQVTGGFGFWRVITEYAHKTSFDLECRIKSIRNPFSVYLDPSGSEPDGSDTNWGLIFDDMIKQEFNALYPRSRLCAMGDWDSLNNTTAGWVTKDGTRFVEYFEKTLKPTKLLLLSNGKTILEEDLPKAGETLGNEDDGTPISLAKDAQGVPISRNTLSPKVMWYKLTAIEILERQEFPCDYIPIIPVYGTELIIEGERILEGIVRHARDPQRMYNFFASYEAETIALAPKAPWIGFAGQFENHEEKWETANVRNHAYLEVNDTSSDGKQVPLPQRNVYEPPVQAITNARQLCAGELKSTTGMYDPSLGRQSNEISGAAIRQRQAQSQTSNFHFADNQKRSVRHTGRILLNMIPRVYDTARTVRIIDAEDEQQIVKINQLFQEDGQHKKHDVTVGDYEVTVDEGPNYQTKRQEMVASALEIVRSSPGVFDRIGDLIVKEMDWSGSQAISDRLKKFLPPNIQDDGGDQIPPQAKAQMAQMQQTMQAMQAEIVKQNQIISSKKMELESKERIEYEKLLADFRIEVMRNDALHAKTAFESEIKTLITHLNLMPPAPGIEPNAGAPGAAQPAQNQPPTGGPSPG